MRLVQIREQLIVLQSSACQMPDRATVYSLEYRSAHMGGYLKHYISIFYLGIFGQQDGVSIVNVAQLFQHLPLMLLPHRVLGVDPAAQISG